MCAPPTVPPTAQSPEEPSRFRWIALDEGYSPNPSALEPWERKLVVDLHTGRIFVPISLIQDCFGVHETTAAILVTGPHSILSENHLWVDLDWVESFFGQGTNPAIQVMLRICSGMRRFAEAKMREGA